ncbi:Nodule Cysteine-Rich (NCR) secreted peptide [Medicago truncatula]|uniref:Nodule Cysteine-Rich (NCR) secreted peptide n=1 Tax=Medicago truncatula TaxID=3880 RepID=A0A072V8R5_MEDTR|nr:Nodule Cysteine-Rich (NCR) secreted peptide [Medicago truncatula]
MFKILLFTSSIIVFLSLFFVTYEVTFDLFLFYIADFWNVCAYNSDCQSYPCDLGESRNCTLNRCICVYNI